MSRRQRTSRRRASWHRVMATQLPIERVAALTQRLAVLLGAGVSPLTVWSYLTPAAAAPLVSNPANRAGVRLSGDTARGAGIRTNAGAGTTTRQALWRNRPRSARGSDPPNDEAIVHAAARAGPRGESVADAIASAAAEFDAQAAASWRGIAAAWAVATQSGAPLSRCLRDLAVSFRELGQVQRDVEVALAGPRATARMVMGLPVIGILLGMLMGFDTLGTLLTTVPGLLCLGAGSLLMFVGARWNRGLVRRAGDRAVAPGLELDLMAIAMSGGGSLSRARELVDAVTIRFDIVASETVAAESGGALVAVLELSERAGVPAAELLRSEAEHARLVARTDGQRRAASLAVTLMLPLGLCILPAFMLVGVAPLLISVVSSTFGSL